MKHLLYIFRYRVGIYLMRLRKTKKILEYLVNRQMAMTRKS